MNRQRNLIEFLRRDFVPEWKECKLAARQGPDYLKAIREGLIEGGVSVVPFVGPATLGFVKSIEKQRGDHRLELVEAVLGLDANQRRGIAKQISISPHILEAVKEFYIATSASQRDKILQVVERVGIELRQEHGEILGRLKAIERILARARIAAFERTTELAGVPAIRETMGPVHAKVLQNPVSAEEYVERGRVYLGTKQYDKAMADFQRAIQVDKSKYLAYFYRATTYFRQGRMAEALGDYNVCIKMDPDDCVALEGRGNIYADTGHHRKALRDYNAAIRMDRNWAIPYFDRGIVFMRRKRYRRAIRSFDLAIEIDPNESFLYGIRGTTYYDMAKYTRALSDFSTAIEMDPKDELSYYQRGTIFAEQRNYEAAIQDFSRSVDLEPNEGNAYAWRASVYWRKGDHNKAVTDYRKAIEHLVLDKDYVHANQALRHMLVVFRRSDKESVLPDLRATLAVVTNDRIMQEKWSKIVSKLVFTIEKQAR